MLERVAGHEAYSFVDGFFGFNQVSIDSKDQHKTAFAMTWGVFMYKKMPFGLTNAPATYQRLMSTAFKEYLPLQGIRLIHALLAAQNDLGKKVSGPCTRACISAARDMRVTTHVKKQSVTWIHESVHTF